MIVAITGGAGFLGQRLVGRLVARGDQVRVIDVAPRPVSFAPEVVYRRADVLDADALGTTFAGVDAVVHAAFAPPQASAGELGEVNVDGPRQVASVAVRCKVRRVVLISSTIVDRPLRPHPLFQRAPLSRLLAYRDTRARGEAALAAVSGVVQTAIVRPKTFLGPGRVGGFALAFTTIRGGGVVPIAGDGRNRYQYVHVDDLADGIVRLIDADAEGVFVFGAPEVGTVRDELLALLDRAGTGARALFLPALVGRATVRGVELAGLAPLSEFHHAAAYGRDSVVDTDRARDELGWVPAHTNVETLFAAYDWYDANAGKGSLTTHPVPLSHRAIRRLLSFAPMSQEPSGLEQAL